MSNGSSTGSGNHSVPQPSSLPLSCADVAPYLSAFADGELASPMREQVASHVSACETCSARIAHFAEIDIALATLPRSRPSVEVYERIAAAVGGRAGEPAVRESLNERRPIHLRRRVELPQWAEEPLAPVPPAGGRSRLPRWVAAGLPTVAAILLVALTAFAIRGLGTRTPQSVTTTHISSPAITGDPLEQTRSAVQAATVGQSLKFTPILPTYVPGAPTFQSVSARVIADPSGSGVLYLDVTWTLSGSVTQVHLREGPKDSPWLGYTPATSPGLTWQVNPQYQWTPLSVNDGSGRLAIGEQRATEWLAMDVTLTPGDQGATATPGGSQDTPGPGIVPLRLMSLSMDAPFQPLPVPRIIGAPSTPMFHYVGTLAGSSGTIEAYSYGSKSYVEVRTADGTHYIDISDGQQGIRLDPNHHTYQQLPPADLTPATLDQKGVSVFQSADTQARGGVLWYVGETQYGGAAAYDFLVVDEPYLTHAYVDAHSQQIVAVTVELNSSLHPGGTSAASRFSDSGCALYTQVESLPTSTNVDFSTAPPNGYVRGSVPPRVACAAGSSQTIRQ